MAEPVELSVRSQLLKIVDDLKVISEQARSVSEELEKGGQAVGEGVDKQVKKTEAGLNSMRSLAGRVAEQLRGDFKGLVSINAVRESLKITDQFRGSIKETFALSDSIRKFGTTFGVVGSDFASFQSKLVNGLGAIGLSSDVATDTLKGLADTNVRGQDSVLGYAQQSGQLASLSGEKGNEGGIAKGIAKTITARGGDANNMDQVKEVTEDLRRAFNQTGKGPTQLLGAMEELFTNMSQDFRKKIGSRGLVNLAAAGQIAGPNSTKFLQEYLGKSPIARTAFEAQGGKGVVTNQGIDTEKFAKFSKTILGRIGNDPRMAAQTLGLSEEAAEGFIRLSESLNKVKAAQDAIKSSTGNVSDQYQSSMGAAEAFRASINRVKKVFSDPLARVTQGGTNMLSKAAKSDAGSAAVVAGGGLLAALLAGGGLRGIGKMAGLGGLATAAVKGSAAEAVTGQKTIPVYVVNASEISGGGVGGALADVAGGAAGGGLLGKIMKGGGALKNAAMGLAATPLGMTGLAAGAGMAAGSAASTLVQPGGLGITAKAMGMDSLGEKLDQLEKTFSEWSARLVGMHGGDEPKPTIPQPAMAPPQRPQRVIVELNKRDLKVSKQPSRGASH